MEKHQRHEVPEATDSTTGRGSGFAVKLFNCNCHSFQQVEEALMRAIGCSSAQAKRFAVIVHNKGFAIVFEGAAPEAETVAIILEGAGLKVKVMQ